MAVFIESRESFYSHSANKLKLSSDGTTVTNNKDIWQVVYGRNVINCDENMNIYTWKIKILKLGNEITIGIDDAAAKNPTSVYYLQNLTTNYAYTSTGIVYKCGELEKKASTFAVGDVITLKLDLDAKTLDFHKYTEYYTQHYIHQIKNIKIDHQQYRLAIYLTGISGVINKKPSSVKIIDYTVQQKQYKKKKTKPWQCPKCTLENAAVSQECDACLAPKPYILASESEDIGNADKKYWKCNVCSLISPRSELSCTVCGNMQCDELLIVTDTEQKEDDEKQMNENANDLFGAALLNEAAANNMLMDDIINDMDEYDIDNLNKKVHQRAQTETMITSESVLMHDMNGRRNDNKIKMLEDKIKRLELENEAMNQLKVENMALKSQMIILNEENEKLKLENAELVNKLKSMKSLDADKVNLELWNENDVLRWILNIEHGIFDKYKHDLKKEIIGAQISGLDLLDVDINDIASFGVKKFSDRKLLQRNIETLKEKHEKKNVDLSVNDENEGDDAATVYM